jgi:hypothetical protein
MQLRRLRIFFFVLVGSSIYFPRDAIYVSTIIFKFAPDRKNLSKVEFI